MELCEGVKQVLGLGLAPGELSLIGTDRNRVARAQRKLACRCWDGSSSGFGGLIKRNPRSCLIHGPQSERSKTQDWSPCRVGNRVLPNISTWNFSLALISAGV